MKSYPKIYNVGHRAVRDIMLDSVLVEEKIDGYLFSAMRKDGVLTCRSKGQELNLEAPESLFIEAIETAKRLPLKDSYTYRFECLKKPKHNSLAYNRTPKDHIILLDVDTAEESYISYEDKVKEAESLGLEVTPKIFEGKIENVDMFMQFLDRESILGGQKIEGVVVKNYTRFADDGHAMMAKFVSEHFKEVHSKEWKNSNPSKNDILLFMVEKYRTPARWDKAVLHLREQGLIEDSPKDIGKIILETQKDIQEECLDEIKEDLLRWAMPHIKRGVVKGLAEYYKEELAKKQFTDSESPSLPQAQS